MSLAACILTVLGILPARLDSAVELVTATCGEDRRCIEIVAVLWSQETADTFAVPKCGRSGCGPLQVIPSRYVSAFDLTDTLDSMKAGWLVYGLKLARAKSERRALVWYNGSKLAERYGARAYRKLRKIRRICGNNLR